MKTITATKFRNNKEPVYNMVNAHEPVKIISDRRHDIILVDANDYFNMVNELEQLKNPWVSVDDDLPDCHERVLALFNGEAIVLELGLESPSYEETFKAFNYWLEPYDEILIPEWHEVTHWMPLPCAI